MVKILLEDIEYIKSLGNYLAIHTKTGRFITHITIKEIEERLTAPRFVRIHHSCIVPINRITEVQGNQLQLGKEKFTIGDVYRKNFYNLIEKHVMKGKK